MAEQNTQPSEKIVLDYQKKSDGRQSAGYAIWWWPVSSIAIGITLLC